MQEVTLIGYIIVPLEDLEAVSNALPTHIQRTREEPGCTQFDVTPDPDAPTLFHVNERFDSPEAFRLHQANVRDSEWGKITANVQRHYQTTGLDADEPPAGKI